MANEVKKNSRPAAAEGQSGPQAQEKAPQSVNAPAEKVTVSAEQSPAVSVSVDEKGNVLSNAGPTEEDIAEPVLEVIAKEAGIPSPALDPIVAAAMETAGMTGGKEEGKKDGKDDGRKDGPEAKDDGSSGKAECGSKENEIGPAGGGSEAPEAGAAESNGTEAEAEGQPGEEQPERPKRDFYAEIEQLVKAHPEACRQGLPNEVVRVSIESGNPVLQVYDAFMIRSLQSQVMALRMENETLRHNERNAMRAPITPVSVNGTDEAKPMDRDAYFMKGFNSYIGSRYEP